MEYGKHGSVHRKDRDNVAYIGHFNDKPLLDWNFGFDADPYCGAASRAV